MMATKQTLCFYLWLTICVGCGTPAQQAPEPSRENASGLEKLKGQSSSSSGEDLSPLILPFAKNAQRIHRFGLKAFGVHGGAYPEGNPAWTFELAPLTAIVSPGDGMIKEILPDPDFPDRERIRIELLGGQVHMDIGYLSYLRSSLRVGVRVKKGMRLGDASFLGSGVGYGLVIQCFLGKTGEPVCPIEFFESSEQQHLRHFYESLPADYRDPYEWDICQSLGFEDPDPLVGVWTQGDAPSHASCPNVITLTPFDVIDGRRAVATASHGAWSVSGVYQWREDESLEVILDDGRSFVGRSFGTELLVESVLVPGTLVTYKKKP